MTTKALIQEEALQKVLLLDRCGAAISMGVGKTLLGLKHMDEHYKMGSRKFLVVAPKKSIFTSWEDDAIKFNLKHLLDHITFSTYVGLNKKDPTKYERIYLDECHSLLDTHEVFLTKYTGGILGLTGTAPRWENSEKGKMVAKYCPMVYKYITDDAVEDGILNDYRIIVHMIPLDAKLSYRKETKDGRTWMTSEAADYTYWCGRINASTTEKQVMFARIRRMTAMMNYPSKEAYARKLLQEQNEKCILFCNTIAQAHKMAAHSYTSKNPKSDKNLELFKTGEIDKLSAVLQLSEGVNIPDLKTAIIMHSYSGNSAKTQQRFGRTCRLLPTETSIVHVLCYANSIDESWCKSTLKDLNQDKIRWIDGAQFLSQRVGSNEYFLSLFNETKDNNLQTDVSGK